jgi:rRNA maturation RNase YbeY
MNLFEISFSAIEISYIPLKNRKLLRSCLQTLIKKENKKVTSVQVNVVFCNDLYLLSLNKSYLNHNTFTDVITFDYCESGIFSGDIFISLERVKENANTFNQTFQSELARVVFHGFLHLSGFGDKTRNEEIVMRGKEEGYLRLFSSSIQNQRGKLDNINLTNSKSIK